MNTQPTVAERAYLAGIIDGEGSVGITKNSGLGTPHSKFPHHFNPYVDISNTSEELLLWIHARFPFAPGVRRNKRNAVWQCRSGGRGVKDLLRVLLRFIIIKRRQAELVITFPQPCDTWIKRPEGMTKYHFQKYRKAKGVIGHRTPEMYAKQVRIYNALLLLNPKGPRGTLIEL